MTWSVPSASMPSWYWSGWIVLKWAPMVVYRLFDPATPVAPPSRKTSACGTNGAVESSPCAVPVWRLAARLIMCIWLIVVLPSTVMLPAVARKLTGTAEVNEPIGAPVPAL